MDDGVMATYVTMSLSAFMISCLPPLIAAVIVGIIVGVIQAATQIQDQTLPQAFKLAAVCLAIAIFAPVLVGSLSSLGETVLNDFPIIVR